MTMKPMTRSEIFMAAATHTHTSLAYGPGLGTNFNSYTSTGVWMFGDLSSYTNKPTNSSENGVLIVFSAAGAIQVFLGGYQKAIYYRCQKSGTWQAWVKVTTSASS